MGRPKKESTTIKENSTASASIAAAFKDVGLEFISAEDAVAPTKFLPTGFAGFDNYTLGRGGIPRGKLVQIFGPPGSGKSLLVMRLVAMDQKENPDKVQVVIDTEFSWEDEWAKAQGVDTKKCMVRQGNITEETHDYAIKLMKSGVVSFLAIDSVANEQLDSQSYTNEKRSKMPGQEAKEMKAFLKSSVALANKHSMGFVFTNQITMKIGVLFGSPETFPGGESLKHNIQLNVRLRAAGFVTDSDSEPIASIVAASVIKSKIGIARKTDDSSHLIFYYQDGINKSLNMGLYDEGVRSGNIVKGGAGWVKVYNSKQDEVLKVHGQDKFLAMLSNEQFATALRRVLDGGMGSDLQDSIQTEPQVSGISESEEVDE
jgi:recombination protein RecA